MSDYVVRAARPGDLHAINAIYDHEVVTGIATFDTEPMSLERRRAWLAAHGTAAHPAIVATAGDQVLGWACLSPWSDRCAYARAAEVSVYIDAAHRRRGAGRALLAELIRRGRQAGLGVLLARIAVDPGGEPAASLALHEALGFRRFGTMRRVGEKFGRILDVELLDLHLDE
ncbi:MAG TPA: GNAT family N-acetyltransferase [Kofleriaceae bacterium]|nr:GNAT family N-acetyltransferase [Kofleriaceae bacterium]